ncbi:MAG: hypothetical protein GY717_13200 [Rhodobacteraceae bacterium]|nr:hypothetical protein [Paracoccaceae bacterium]
MELFTEEELGRLNKILELEINPFLHGEAGTFEISLGAITKKWLFETHLNLPSDAREELRPVLSEGVSDRVKVFELNNLLEQRQVNSAPKWWELEFFDFDRKELWHFVVEQCRRNYKEDYLRETFDHYIEQLEALNAARHVLYVSKHNKDKFSEKEVMKALSVYDQSYPLDFKDYDEVPQRVRSPLEAIQEMIARELSDLEAIFTKRWFEFKILDELAAFELFHHDGERDSELSRKIAAQVRGYMQRRLMSLGRMVEHYRWKFSYEGAAIKGIQSTQSDEARGRKGGEASERLKRDNIEAFWAEIEVLGDLFPRMSEQSIFAQAYANAAAKRKMPKSRKTIENYGVTIRSEQPFKARFDALFRKKA